MMKGNVVLPTPETVARAAALLRTGGLVAFPTETVYGLGGDALNETAVEAIFAEKGRQRFNPLIVNVLGLSEDVVLGQFDCSAREVGGPLCAGPVILVP